MLIKYRYCKKFVPSGFFNDIKVESDKKLNDHISKLNRTVMTTGRFIRLLCYITDSRVSVRISALGSAIN